MLLLLRIFTWAALPILAKIFEPKPMQDFAEWNKFLKISRPTSVTASC